MLLYGAGAAFLCLEPEPTQFGRSWSRLQDLGIPPKKVPAPQHWLKDPYHEPEKKMRWGEGVFKF